MDSNNRFSSSLPYEKKHILDLIPGDIVLHSIYRADGLMLVNKNRLLTTNLIDIIRKHTDPMSYVIVTHSKKALEYIYNHNILNSPKFKKDLYEIDKSYTIDTSFKNKKYIENNIINKQSPNASLLEITLLSSPLWLNLDQKLESEHLKIRAIRIKKHLLKLMSNDKIFNELFYSMKEYDDVLMLHSINTTCISLMIGLTLELSDDELLDLAMSSLFSNVGFLEIPKADFIKFLKSEYMNLDSIKRHLESFSKVTANSTYLRKKSIIYGILDHHEYYNGNGLPLGKRGEDISLFGRILLIAQTYDELVGGYKFTAPLSPMAALKLVYENREGMFDQSILNAFINRTTYFKLGQTITLPKKMYNNSNDNIVISNDTKAKIIGFENFLKYPHLPIVKLLNGKIINLLENFLYEK